MNDIDKTILWQQHSPKDNCFSDIGLAIRIMFGQLTIPHLVLESLMGYAIIIY